MASAAMTLGSSTADRSRFALTYEAVVHTARASTTGTGAAQVVVIDQLGPDGLGEHSGICGCLPGAVGTSGAECSSVVVSLREGIEP